jgi:hypothetical protein
MVGTVKPEQALSKIPQAKAQTARERAAAKKLSRTRAEVDARVAASGAEMIEIPSTIIDSDSGSEQ